ncbi:LacI family DNA-binding transcriptional regulator [Thermicanus aegyptius]|uniref:LacI family DNA-binding transcriptional regulator n=1 Tax=Thermicanus aegyptius TaxID=94009 RepID=UPI000412C513|nr:LacI family DNA-binding transcriptional regulator [Thermicanus aegyptius]
MKPTIYDVARIASVSIATVSKVINGKGNISDKTRQKVLNVMKELQYQPNVLASALTGKRTYTIGLLLPDISNPFFAEIARAVEDRGGELGFNVMICSTDNNDAKVEKYISLLRQKSVDGIIIGTGVQDQEILASIATEGFPLALIARDMPSLAVDTVLVDDFVGGYLATKHLLDLGHRRIAVVTENLKVSSSRDRLRGYRQALEDKGICYDETLIKTTDFSIADGKKKALELFEAELLPTAVFACNDLLAIGVMQAAKERGLRVPADLSVVGFDNTILATITDPMLTTVAQPIEHMGKQVVDLLVQQMTQEPRTKQRVILRPELIIRNSTNVPKA